MDFSTFEQEIELRTARSGGPGGQHANKTETKVELRWDLPASQAVSSEERRRIRYHLKKQLTESGLLIVTDQSSRSQHRNRELAHREIHRLLRKGLRPIPPKRTAGAFKANQRKRRQAKKRQSEKKKERRWRY